MLKMVKTTTMTTLAALTLVAGLSTQANAATTLPTSVKSLVQTPQFDEIESFAGLTNEPLAEDAVVTKTANFRGRRGFSSRRGFNSRGFNGRRGFTCLLYTSPSPRD